MPTGSGMYLVLSLDSLSGSISDLTEIQTLNISNLLDARSGEAYLAELSSVSVSEFLIGELIKHSSSPKQILLRYYFGTRR